MTILAIAPPTATTRYSIRLATEGVQVRAAQELRHQVFAGELGATLYPTEPGIDVDGFDALCDHLIIVDDTSGQVVGTYRLLPPGRSLRLYCDGEFDLSRLAPLRHILVETGRSCVHPDHRTGAVINLMWAGIMRYMHLSGLRWVAGCASVPLADGGADAAGVWQLAKDRYLAPPALRVRPLDPWRYDGPVAAAGRATVPPLLKGYLRLGAWIGGEPAYDRDFGVADFFVLLSLDRIDPRYTRHFMGETNTPAQRRLTPRRDPQLSP